MGKRKIEGEWEKYSGRSKAKEEKKFNKKFELHPTLSWVELCKPDK